MAKSTRKSAPAKKRQPALKVPPQPIPLRRVSKGTRPQFYENNGIDHLFAIVTALTAETSVAFDRIDTLERVLAAAGSVAAADIEAYVPDPATAELRRARRDELIQRVFAVFEATAAGKSR